MVQEQQAEIGFRELIAGGGEVELVSTPVAEMEVVLVSPRDSELPVAVSWDDVVRQRLILPPSGSGRRQLIDDQIARWTGDGPQVSLVTEDRGSSRVAATQAGMGSFLSYRCLVAGLDGLEIRPFDPPRRSLWDSFTAPARSRNQRGGSWSSRRGRRG